MLVLKRKAKKMQAARPESASEPGPVPAGE
jgi:hypothetical protein